VTEASDDSLIDDIVARRSERAARVLVERYSPRLLASVRRLMANDSSAAEDVLQQAWVNAISSLPSFRRDASFSTWMHRIAIRAALDHLRTRTPLRDCAADAVLADLPAATSDVDGQLDLERLIGQLPAGCRSVLVLHDVEGFTHEEIAASLGIAVGTSKAHLFRARRLLRRWLSLDTDMEAIS
jgi:RNA polymerase sigma factor (sigma-70 family)